MGKDWDTDKGGRDNWIAWMTEIAKECLRVLKPGGHAFVWSIPRTSHWTATAWENAGFEIRDVVAHIFGSGFPKSLSVGKAVDKLQGNEREVVGKQEITGQALGINKGLGKSSGEIEFKTNWNLTKGTSEWEGWGTALKPAREDWLLMRKPLEKGLTIAENVLKYGTGGINIDESRVDALPRKTGTKPTSDEATGSGNTLQGSSKNRQAEYDEQNLGRFPANLIHDNSEEVRECFPETKSGAMNGTYKNTMMKGKPGVRDGKEIHLHQEASSGNASRFFKSIIYTAKASKSERNKGCEELEEKEIKHGLHSTSYIGEVECKTHTVGKNNHPTVKPIALMEYLIKMVTPKGGIVLDPFMGSGSTGCACKQNGFDFIGIEKEPEYVKIAEARIKSVPDILI